MGAWAGGAESRRVARGSEQRQRAYSKTCAILASRSSRMKPGLARSFPEATSASHRCFATSAAVQDASAIFSLCLK
jgi:hypothetical protein